MSEDLGFFLFFKNQLLVSSWGKGATSFNDFKNNSLDLLSSSWVKRVIFSRRWSAQGQRVDVFAAWGCVFRAGFGVQGSGFRVYGAGPDCMGGCGTPDFEFDKC